MTYLIFMLAVLVIGVSVLMTGILVNREPGQSVTGALADSVVWGLGFVVSFGAEFVLLANI